MKAKLKPGALMVMLASLSAPEMVMAASSTTATTVAVMPIPTYTLLTDVLDEMVPKTNGKVNESVMQMVCDIARGDRTKADIQRILKNSRVNVSDVPVKGSPLSVLVHGDERHLQSVCAAYLATSLFSAPDNISYRSVQKEQVSEEKLLPPPSAWKFWEEQKSETVTREREKISWDTTKFAKDVKVQVALAKATAQLYALLAYNMGDQPQTSAMADARVKQSLGDLAGDYLTSLQQIYHDTQAQTMVVKQLSESEYVVSDGAGYILQRNDAGMHLTYRSIEWLGNGKILGKEYFVNLSLVELAPPVVAAPEPQPEPELAPESEPEKKPTVKGRKRY